MGLRWIGAMLGIIALALPVLELVGIYQIWQIAGWWTLVWLAMAVIAGIQLMALERLAFLPRMMASLSSGQMPFAILTGSGLRFVAAGLLIFPGAISDVVALALLLVSLFFRGPRSGRADAASPETTAPGYRPTAANDDIIEGEFRRED
jgi:UPF0716 protein FxsA